MSSKHGDSVPFDDYPTPAWCVFRLLEELVMPVAPGSVWLEPAAGSGNIIRAVNTYYRDSAPSWVAVEIQKCDLLGCPDPLPQGTLSFTGVDFRTWARDAGSEKYAVAITNPPYSIAFDFLVTCRARAREVILLTRLNWLASAKRHAYLRRDMPDVYILPNRPSFTAKGTDSCEYAWLHWGKRPQTDGVVRVLNLTSLDARKLDPCTTTWSALTKS